MPLRRLAKRKSAAVKPASAQPIAAKTGLAKRPNVKPIAAKTGLAMRIAALTAPVKRPNSKRRDADQATVKPRLGSKHTDFVFLFINTDTTPDDYGLYSSVRLV